MSDPLPNCPICGDMAIKTPRGSVYCCSWDCPLSATAFEEDQWIKLASLLAELEERVDFWHNCSNAHEGCRDALRDMYAKLEAERDRLRKALEYLCDEVAMSLADLDAKYSDDTSKGLRKAWQYARAALTPMEEKP